MERIDWGLIPYEQAYARQQELFEKALQRKAAHEVVENKFIFCEHPPVITIGKNGMLSNLLFSVEILKARGVELYPVDRGGDITYHGPGQIVGYPILDLDVYHWGLKEYINRLEEMIIQTLAAYGIHGERLASAPGVWLDTDKPAKIRKIAAIGVRSSRYITMHGFALNVNTDLSYFQLINPCGFTDKGVTSMQQELGAAVDMEEVKDLLYSHLQAYSFLV